MEHLRSKTASPSPRVCGPVRLNTSSMPAFMTIMAKIHCVQKKTPIHVFFYISVENVYIYTKFSGYVYAELRILGT